LHQLLGQPVSGSAHRRGLRLDAGITFASCRYSLCPLPGPHLARAIAQARGSGNGLGTALGHSPAHVVSVSICLPSYRLAFGCSERIDLPLLAIPNETGRTPDEGVSPLVKIHISTQLTGFGISNRIEVNSALVAITYHSGEKSRAAPLFMNNAG
jgi:hypothetical protein